MFGQIMGNYPFGSLSLCSVLIVVPLISVRPSFAFGVLDGRCLVVVSIPGHCFSFYLHPPHATRHQYEL